MSISQHSALCCVYLEVIAAETRLLTPSNCFRPTEAARRGRHLCGETSHSNA